jgi:predicted RNase H-like HicB family nuclease
MMGDGGNAGWASSPFKEYHGLMDLQFTAVFRKVPEGYIGFVEELPGANTQGATLEETRANLREAVAMVLQANRELIDEASSGAEVIREPFKVGA